MTSVLRRALKPPRVAPAGDTATDALAAPPVATRRFRLNGLRRRQITRHAMRSGVRRALVDIAARGFCLSAGFTLALATGSVGTSIATALLLIVVAVVMTGLAVRDGAMTRLYVYALGIEAAVAMVMVTVIAPTLNPYIIYVAAVPLLGGLRAGALAAFVIAAIEALTLLLLHDGQSPLSPALVGFGGPWMVIGIAAGLLGTLIRQLRLTERDTAQTPYASAHRLLGQLRTITRELPGGLDIDVVSENVLSRALKSLAGERASLLLKQESGHCVEIANAGSGGAVIASETDSIVAAAIGLQRRSQEPQPYAPAEFRHRICLPLVVGTRAIGAVVVDGPSSVPKDVIESLQHTLNDDALRIESAMLFSDVRALATVEERRRLAREIHDGVAQEIASLGYMVDELAREDCDASHQAGLWSLRDELTRVVTELRLSIFDLRIGVTTHAGLGSVIADYTREMGKGSGMAVHMLLEESGRRLRLDVETELLRVAQEAITNARKHSRATNLWVTCRVEPPFAEIRVEDDGIGCATNRDHHYGLHIMKERASRINAVLTISNRPTGGTVVSAVLLPTELSVQRSQSGGSHALYRAAG